MKNKFLSMLQKYNINKPDKSLSEVLIEPGRFNDFSAHAGELLLDFSRTSMDRSALDQLLVLAEKCGVQAARERLFAAQNINFTEQRPALHMALRSAKVLHQLDAETVTRVTASRAQLFSFARAFAAGHLPGEPQQRVSHIVHIGIGGSMLGPRLLIEALGKDSPLQVHFLASVDAHHRSRLLAQLEPSETVVIIATKSFTTGETLLHARRLQQWLEQGLGKAGAAQRLYGVSENLSRAETFGIPTANVLYLPAWVGGRYSIWSSVSLAAVAVMGVAAFEQLLQGAAAMDRHFQTAKSAGNLPILMALTGIWHRNICHYPAQAVIPYDHRLRSLPAYLQQLVMESGGKSVDQQGEKIQGETAPVLFGEPGSDAQHSLFQLFHQGTDIVPLSFIGVIRPDHGDGEAHASLLANMLAQATALATGTGGEPESGSTAAHRYMPGNRPSEILLMDELSPHNLGQLLALYEHKVFVESVLWDINPFDQFGVELGKILATTIQPALQDSAQEVPANFGLDALLDYIRSKK